MNLLTYLFTILTNILQSVCTGTFKEMWIIFLRVDTTFIYMTKTRS